MKKIISLIILFCLFFVNIAIVLALPSEASLVFTSPGADASTQINISWHASAEGTNLIYTTKADATYTDATTVEPTEVSAVFDNYASSTATSIGYYRCTVSLSDLASGTDFRFKVGKDNYTSDYFFKTADNSDSFSFVFMSDIHAYPASAERMSTAEALITKAESKQGNLDFILFAGDLTAHGSDYNQWKHFNGGSFIKNYMVATTPGNHDYYKATAEVEHTDDRWYNAMFNNPKNGMASSLNSTYFFKYNNVLFIAMNSELRNQTQVTAQKEWVSSVVKNNPSDFIVAFEHRELFSGSTAGGGASVSKSNEYNWYGALLEELGVDLVLTGDDHVYVRTKPILNGQVSTPDKGTVYITSNQIGSRGRIATAPSQYSEVIYGGTTADNKVSSLSIINVSKTAITGEMFDASGNVHDTYSIPCKKEDIGDFDRDAYAATFNISKNLADLNLGKLNFTNLGWDKVRDIKVCNSAANNYVYNTIEPTEDITEFLFGPIPPGRTLEIRILITFKDATTKEVFKTLVNKEDSGTCTNFRVEETDGILYFKWDNNLVASQIKKVDFKIDGFLIESIDANVSQYDLTNQLTESDNELSLIVTDIYNERILNETISYTFSSEEVTPVTPDAPKKGCKANAVSFFFLVIGFGALLLKRKEII